MAAVMKIDDMVKNFVEKYDRLREEAENFVRELISIAEEAYKRNDQRTLIWALETLYDVIIGVDNLSKDKRIKILKELGKVDNLKRFIKAFYCGLREVYRHEIYYARRFVYLMYAISFVYKGRSDAEFENYIKFMLFDFVKFMNIDLRDAKDDEIKLMLKGILENIGWQYSENKNILEDFYNAFPKIVVDIVNSGAHLRIPDDEREKVREVFKDENSFKQKFDICRHYLSYLGEEKQ